MGIAVGTTITVEFDAQQIAQLDLVLQQAEMHLYTEPEMKDYKKGIEERVANIYRALHKAGYR
jgi:soluble cytochrome b562